MDPNYNNNNNNNQLLLSDKEKNNMIANALQRSPQFAEELISMIPSEWKEKILDKVRSIRFVEPIPKPTSSSSKTTKATQKDLTLEKSQRGTDVYLKCKSELDKLREAIQNNSDMAASYNVSNFIIPQTIDYTSVESMETGLKGAIQNMNQFTIFSKVQYFNFGKIIYNLKEKVMEHNNLYTNTKTKVNYFEKLKEWGFHQSESTARSYMDFYSLCTHYPNLLLLQSVSFSDIISNTGHLENHFLRDKEYWVLPLVHTITVPKYQFNLDFSMKGITPVNHTYDTESEVCNHGLSHTVVPTSTINNGSGTQTRLTIQPKDLQEIRDQIRDSLKEMGTNSVRKDTSGVRDWILTHYFDLADRSNPDAIKLVEDEIIIFIEPKKK